VRLFVALDLPRSLRERLSWMAGGLPGARWVPPENYHVTLRFVGELPGWRAEEVDHALAGLRARSFTLQLAGIGTHQKGGKVEALWAGVERTPALHSACHAGPAERHPRGEGRCLGCRAQPFP